MGVHKIHALGPPERMRAPAERRRAAQAAMGMLMQTAAAIVAESGAMSAQQEAEVRRLIDEANRLAAQQRSAKLSLPRLPTLHDRITVCTVCILSYRVLGQVFTPCMLHGARARAVVGCGWIGGRRCGACGWRGVRGA